MNEAILHAKCLVEENGKFRCFLCDDHLIDNTTSSDESENPTDDDDQLS